MTAAAVGSAAAAQIARATRASGVICHVAPAEFLVLVAYNAEPLVVCATAGVFSTRYEYLTSYRGLAFFTRSPTPLRLPDHAQTVQARRIWVP